MVRDRGPRFPMSSRGLSVLILHSPPAPQVMRTTRQRVISLTLPNELQVKSRRRSRPAAEPPLPPATPPHDSHASPRHASRRECTPISRHVGRLALTVTLLSAGQARSPLNARLAPSPVPLPRRRRSARPLRQLAGGHPLLSRQDRCAARIRLRQYLLWSTVPSNRCTKLGVDGNVTIATTIARKERRRFSHPASTSPSPSRPGLLPLVSRDDTTLTHAHVYRSYCGARMCTGTRRGL